MATAHQNLSAVHAGSEVSAAGVRVGILVAEWNRQVNEALLKGAKDELVKRGGDEAEILVEWVPGAFELPYGAKLMAQMTDVDAIICLGCVIRGETPHFDYVCQAATEGILRVGLEMEVPVIFGVLTVDTLEQALARAGGTHGNKGAEAAVAALQMASLARRLSRFDEPRV